MTDRASFVLRVAAIHDRDDKNAVLETIYETILYRIARKYDFAVLMNEDVSLTTTVGQVTETLPSGTNRIYRIIWEDSANSCDIVGISPREFDFMFPYPTSYGNAVPRFYCRRNETTIDLANPPNDTKTLRIYRSKWPTVSDETDAEYVYMDDVIEAGMVAELYHQLGLDTDANTWWTKFKQMLDEAHEKDTEHPDMIRVMKGFQPYIRARGDYWANPFVRNNP